MIQIRSDGAGRGRPHPGRRGIRYDGVTERTQFRGTLHHADDGAPNPWRLQDASLAGAGERQAADGESVSNSGSAYGGRVEWVVGPDHDKCVLIYTGIDGATEDMSAAGLKYRRTDKDEAIAEYAFLFAPTPVYWHAAYAMLALIMIAWLTHRQRSADIAKRAMLASALAFALSFAVISIACDYRYLFALDLATIAGLLYVAATRKQGNRRRLG